ncbi:hypothetical protein ACWDRR_38115 [Kitasatospora sp. NPDC003701]
MHAPSPRRAARGVLLAAVTTVLVAGCGAESDGGFDSQDAAPSATCIQHQHQSPGRRYTGRENSDPRSVLEMMRFYTANGTKAFCDGKPATDTDRRWTELYVALGGDPSHVAVA